MLRTKWVPGAAVALAVMLAAGAATARPLSVEIWTDRGDDAVYQPGNNMQVKARSNDDMASSCWPRKRNTQPRRYSNR